MINVFNKLYSNHALRLLSRFRCTSGTDTFLLSESVYIYRIHSTTHACSAGVSPKARGCPRALLCLCFTLADFLYLAREILTEEIVVTMTKFSVPNSQASYVGLHTGHRLGIRTQSAQRYCWRSRCVAYSLTYGIGLLGPASRYPITHVIGRSAWLSPPSFQSTTYTNFLNVHVRIIYTSV